MEGQNPEKKKSDEIDLGQMFSSFGDAFGRGWLNFMRFLANMRRIPYENKISFLLIIAASIALGVYFTKFVRKNEYESTMILRCDYLNSKLADNTIDKLDALAKEPGKKGLIKALNLPDSIARNILGFRISPIFNERDVIEVEILKEQLRAAQTPASQKVIDEVTERIELENRHTFEITVRMLKPSVITDLQNGIIHYFLSAPYIKNRIEENKIALKLKLNQLTNDVNKLDSLKLMMNMSLGAIATQKSGSNNVILGDKGTSDPVLVYSQGLALYDVLDEVRKELFLQEDFEIVDGFTEFSEPASPRMSVMLLYSFFIGLGVAYLEVGLRKFNKYLSTLH